VCKIPPLNTAVNFVFRFVFITVWLQTEVSLLSGYFPYSYGDVVEPWKFVLVIFPHSYGEPYGMWYQSSMFHAFSPIEYKDDRIDWILCKLLQKERYLKNYLRHRPELRLVRHPTHHDMGERIILLDDNNNT
jgi:hypothetical protein